MRLFSEYHWFALLVCLAIPDMASAHALPESRVMLNIGHDSINAELFIPANVFRLLSHNLFSTSDSELTDKAQRQLEDFLRAHIVPRSFEGELWSVKLTRAELLAGDKLSPDNQVLHADVIMTPPNGKPVDRFIFAYDVVGHRLVTHKTLVYLVGNWKAGWIKGEEAPRLLGVLRYKHRELRINQSLGDSWNGIKKMAEWGGLHVLNGADHLLFLLALLVASPLAIKKNSWAQPRSISNTLIVVIKLVTCFTLGHSATLILSALLWSHGESWFIETLIALTLLFAAIHLIKPIMRNREAWLASVFGLIHGLAFASTLDGITNDQTTLALSVFAFNLGIEIAQLAIIVMIVPGLLIIARTRYYGLLRLGAGGVGIAAAFVWGIDRATGFGHQLASQLDQFLDKEVIGSVYIAFIAISLVLFPMVIKEGSSKQHTSVSQTR